jgi:hypothetical protein
MPTVAVTLRLCGHSRASPATIGQCADTSIDGVQMSETRCVTSCPFCGNAARTKEHVWPRWLRKYGAYQVMSEGRSGQRFERSEYVLQRDGENRLREVVTEQRHVAEFLPDVRVDVCSNCNNGWMAAMEIAVRDLLDPVMRSDGTDVTAWLEPEDQVLLATWMSKCVYAYSADLTPQNRPWSKSEYFDLRSSQKPSPRAVVWAGKNVGLTADIVLSLTPLWIMSLRMQGEDPEGPPGAACAWLSANTVVFYAQWWPPERVVTAVPERLAAEDVDSMLRIWPPSEPTAWPSALVEDDNAFALIDRFATMRDRMGISVDGLTIEEIDAIKSDLLASGPPDVENPLMVLDRRRLSRPQD